MEQGLKYEKFLYIQNKKYRLTKLNKIKAISYVFIKYENAIILQLEPFTFHPKKMNFN